MSLLALIPARGGSKRVPKKNIKLLNGKPLINWTIDEALKVNSIDRIIVSTDDNEIANLALEAGAEVPFLRPENLSDDYSLSIDVVVHILERFPEISNVLLLQPTSPFRTADDIHNIIEMKFKYKYDSIVSLSKSIIKSELIYQLDSNKLLKKAIKNNNEIYTLNGALYLSSRTFIEENKSFIADTTVGYIMPTERSLDIDTPLDWLGAEFIISNQKYVSHNLKQ